MGFSLRQLDNLGSVKVGLVECINSGLLIPYPVLTEKEGEYVAQFMVTVLLHPSKTQKLTSYSYDESKVDSKVEITDPSIIDLLKLEIYNKKAEKKK